jgi:hypothetical protein
MKTCCHLNLFINSFTKSDLNWLKISLGRREDMTEVFKLVTRICQKHESTISGNEISV